MGLRTDQSAPAAPAPSNGPIPRHVRNDITESADLERTLIELYGGGPSESGVSVTPDSAMRCAAVYTCTRVLSESLAQSLPDIYRVGADNVRTPERTHWSYGLLHDAPNPWQTAFEFWEMVMAQLCLRGNAYVYKNRLMSGKIAELITLNNPDAMEVAQNPDHSLRYKYTTIAGKPVTFAPGEIWHIRGMSTDGFTGLNPIRAMREAVGLSKATEAHGARLFKNGPRPGLVISHPKALSDNARRNITKSIDEQVGGANQHRPLLLEEDMKPTVLAMSNEDAQFLETRKYQRGEIAALFRVPPHMIGDLERATFSNIEQQSLEFVNRSMMPWFVRLQSSIRMNLLADAERSTIAVRFDAKALLQGDMMSRYQAHNLSVLGGWGTRNEARIAEGRNPMDGLDEPLAPQNMTIGNPLPAGQQQQQQQK